MTNILATITLVVTTNWMTVSITKPVSDPSSVVYAVNRVDTQNQIGARVTNTVATVVWKGKTNRFVLESTEVFFHGDLSRSIPVATIPQDMKDAIDNRLHLMTP
jgi:hypothetical protein